MIQLPNSSWFTIKYEPRKKTKLIKPVENTEKGVNCKEKNTEKDVREWYA